MVARKRNSVDRGQGTIAFARKPRRPGARTLPSSGRKSKEDVIGGKPSLNPRVQGNRAAVSETSADIEEILNGADSRALLHELRTDRFDCPRFHQDDLSISQQLLRQFDMIQEYGPCQGLTRLQRWNRAEKFGKNPPRHIKVVLEAAQSRPEYANEIEMSVYGRLH